MNYDETYVLDLVTQVGKLKAANEKLLEQIGELETANENLMEENELLDARAYLLEEELEEFYDCYSGDNDEFIYQEIN